MKDNKLIAEFMGAVGTPMYAPKEWDIYITGHLDVDSDNENAQHFFTPKEMKYHSSWDWLMPVVEKIEREHKANFRIKCTWNEFTEHSIHQVIVNIEQGEMSKDKSCIYDSKKIYDYVGDAVKCKREATYKAVVEFINQLNNQ